MLVMQHASRHTSENIFGDLEKDAGANADDLDPNGVQVITVGLKHRDMPHTCGASYLLSKEPDRRSQGETGVLAPGERDPIVRGRAREGWGNQSSAFLSIPRSRKQRKRSP
jgi:hypothetical protein